MAPPPPGPRPYGGRVSDSVTYTHGHDESVLRSHRWRTVANSAAYLLPELRPGQVVLDVGCGPGTITAELATLVAPGRVIGVDASAEVLESARAAAEARGVVVELRVGDALALDLPDASVDVVHAHQVLQHLADPVAALGEWRRVCRPGGVVAARDADYAAMAWFPDEPLLDRWLELYRTAARANGGEPDAGRRLLAWAHAAGFDDVTATASVWCFATPDDRGWWGSTWAARTRGTRLGETLVASGVTDITELQDVAEAWERWSGAPDGWFLVPHGEVLARAPLG